MCARRARLKRIAKVSFGYYSLVFAKMQRRETLAATTQKHIVADNSTKQNTKSCGAARLVSMCRNGGAGHC